MVAAACGGSKGTAAADSHRSPAGGTADSHRPDEELPEPGYAASADASKSRACETEAEGFQTATTAASWLHQLGPTTCTTACTAAGTAGTLGTAGTADTAGTAGTAVLDTMDVLDTTGRERISEQRTGGKQT